MKYFESIIYLFGVVFINCSNVMSDEEFEKISLPQFDMTVDEIY